MSIHREFLRWKKSNDFQIWKHDQFLKQGGTCYYCDTPLNGVRQNVEHIVPKSKGGTNHKSNLVLSCSDCNKDKGTKLLTNNEKLYLEQKNRSKRGTYSQLREQYKSEADIGYELRMMFKED